jgi:spore coat protein U-like protein
MTRIHKLTILISSLSLSCAAVAATEITTMPITASVAAACSVSSTGADFGSIVAFTGANASGTIDVNCSPGINYNVALNSGLHPLDGNSVRSMQSAGGAAIRYQIIKGSGTGGAGTAWGDAGLGNTFTGGTPALGFSDGTTQQLNFNVNVVQDGVNVYTPGATYSDTVQITVDF